MKIARAYGVSAINGLVALGLLDDSDISQLQISDALINASNDELLQELARRLKENADADWANSPIIYREEFDMAANDDPNARLEAETPED